MIGASIPRDMEEISFCIACSSRTDPVQDRVAIAIPDRGKEDGSPTFPNALRDQKDPRSIKMSFSNTNQRSRGGIGDESRN